MSTETMTFYQAIKAMQRASKHAVNMREDLEWRRLQQLSEPEQQQWLAESEKKYEEAKAEFERCKQVVIEMREATA